MLFTIYLHMMIFIVLIILKDLKQILSLPIFDLLTKLNAALASTGCIRRTSRETLYAELGLTLSILGFWVQIGIRGGETTLRAFNPHKSKSIGAQIMILIPKLGQHVSFRKI